MNKPSIAAIALGSNLGDSAAILAAAIAQLEQPPNITLHRRSHWYRTPAITLPNSPPQPDYLNGCAIVHTCLTPIALLQTLWRIEAQLGRVRHTPWAARTLDLDLLLFDDVIWHSADLQIPHPRLTERAFVLVPLAEIAPTWIEPLSQKSIANLVQAVDCSDIKKLVIDR